MSKLTLPNPLRWFDIRGRQVGTWAFMLNRLTALALTFYLILHLVVLNKLTQGAQAYDEFVLFAQLPLIKLGEILLIAAVFLHGLNGLRLIFAAFGIGLRYQKLLFGITLLVTIVVSALFGLRMFGQ
jgi:succinate dehydrogenase / fumarate reductase, cytochrome b subunit